ncbi:MAG: HlyD family efflux transporter periplasmic adaptor subunit [Planctomycetota bacterium]|nr:HlyD family efflux transporter periplasmic adaptor subunit [Planctomycetota bacterium]
MRRFLMYTVILGCLATPGLLVAQRFQEAKLPAAVAGQKRLQNCRVSYVNEAQVPAQEAGVLVELPIVQGAQITANQLIAKIEDSQALMQGKAALAELTAAREKAASIVDEEIAKKKAEQAKVEWEKAVAANNRTKGAYSDVDISRLKLTYQHALLEIERAISERKLAGSMADVKVVEVEAARKSLERRQIRSPIDGIVMEVNLHRGEWVKPGDSVAWIAQLDELMVEGRIKKANFSPDSFVDKPVKIEFELSNGQREQLDGQIVFVRPSIEAGDVRVYAKVKNKKAKGHWALLPGMDAVDMIVE